MNDDCCYKLYMHVNKINGKVYIGQTKKSYLSRWDNGNGYGRCSRFAKAIKKYGWDGFEHIPLIEGLTKSEADYFERFFIAFFDSQNPEFGYNLTAGGDECPMDNPVVKAKHDEAMKKVYADPRWQENVRKANQKKSADPDYRETMKKVYADPDYRETMKKVYADPRWQENVRKANQKNSADPKWQEKNREGAKKRCKKVRCVETKIVYDSQKEAAIAVNLKDSSGSISRCCRGKIPTAGGYHWEYVDEELKNKYVPYASKHKRVRCVETKIVYDSQKEAAIAVNLKTQTPIGLCCSGKRKTAGGYHWEYV